MQNGLMVGCHNSCRQDGCLKNDWLATAGWQGWRLSRQLPARVFTATPLSLIFGFDTFYRFRNLKNTHTTKQYGPFNTSRTEHY